MPCTKPNPITSLPLEGQVGGGTPVASDGSRTVTLNVLPSAHKPARSKSAGRRAAVLIFVHILFAAHITWWLLKGDVLTPVEPSEAAFTLEQGLVNAGFVFFVSSILLQLIFGRFMCGWACHVVALQDLCAWLLKKVGIRPHPFRSRLLMWAPFVLAFYMFIWPTLKREWLHPLATKHTPWLAEVMGSPTPFPAHGFTAHFITDDFWATFASIGVAIPFMLVCAGLCVYFLGAKGYCTYGCPYGGFFTPVDRFSPGRIIVDASKCEGCGHCTAVCTSNVRVHEEIKTHGMVVNPGCMKCLDCVSVCPNDALRFGFAKPAAFTKPIEQTSPERERAGALKGRKSHSNLTPAARTYDLTWPEEIALALVFLGTFWSTRGAYELFPVLFAMGIAGCVTFLAFKAWRTLSGTTALRAVSSPAPRPPPTTSVRALGLQLRKQGRVTAAGWAFSFATLALLALVAHTGVVTYHIVRGDRMFEAAYMSKEALLGNPPAPVPSEKKAGAERALAFYGTAGPIWRGGGVALLPNGFVERNSALMHLVAGDPASAEASLRRLIATHGEADNLLVDIGRMMDRQGKSGERRAMMDEVLARKPEFWSLRERRAAEWIAAGRAADALADADATLTKLGDHWRNRDARARTHMIAAWALGSMGRPDEAFARLQQAAKAAPGHAAARAGLAMGHLQIKRDPASAKPELEAALKKEPGNVDWRMLLGQLRLGDGNVKGALEQFTLARRIRPDDPRLADAVGMMLDQSGNAVEAAKWRRETEPRP
ncbi:MAG: tetratricopeptide repeat protein [Phycisphaerales bacterium]